MKHVAQLIGGLLWIWGLVLAKGFWLTLAAIFIPFVSWYLVVKHLVG